MSIREEIEQLSLQAFTFLQKEYGFKPPKIRRETWMTRMDFIYGKIAIELEIDWRESDVFLLIVRLEGGNLPKGYYVSGGKRTRVHLLTIIERKSWPVDQSLISQIRSHRGRSASELTSKVEAYSKLLRFCLAQLLAAGDTLFEEL